MIEKDGDRLMVSGRLTMYTVPQDYEAGLTFLAGTDLLVDMSRVEAVDSAAIGMLLGWKRAAELAGRKLRVENLPEDLVSLASLYGVAELLPN